MNAITTLGLAFDLGPSSPAGGTFRVWLLDGATVVFDQSFPSP